MKKKDYLSVTEVSYSCTLLSSYFNKENLATSQFSDFALKLEKFSIVNFSDLLLVTKFAKINKLHLTLMTLRYMYASP